MSTNAEIATLFDEMASVLELTGASPFRVIAYRNASRAVKDLAVDVATLAGERKKLLEIDGIGEGTAKKIAEYVETGRIADHDELLASVPAGLLEVMRVPGLGPKTVKLLWEQAGVTDVPSLRRALDAGDVEALPRMGAKTVQNIRDALELVSKRSGRVRLGTALPAAEAIVETLRAVPGARRVEHAGSLRRGRETIGDLDILAAADDPAALSEAFRALPDVAKVLAAGETKSSIRFSSGLQADLRVVDEDAFGAALLYFTGSKEHNVLLRERAIRAGYRLNEYGLFPDDGDETPPQQRGVSPVAAATEAEVYAALDLPWIAPELREARGELRAEQPTLIELDDVKAELHAHTTASDGKMTIDELAAAAKARGFHTVAVTDHSKSSAQAGGLDEDALRAHVDAVREADERTRGITILAGSEVDVLASGRLDYDDETLALLDIVVASPHTALRQDEKAATKRLLAAIRHPLVHVIGHPTGRVVNGREGLRPDVEALAEAAAEHDTALELNANDRRLDLRDAHVRAVVDAGGLIAIDTDAHVPDDLDLLRYGVLTARRGWLGPAQCVNAWPARKLHAWLKAKR